MFASSSSNRFLPFALGVILTAGAPTAARAAALAQDSAANYTTATWVNGSNLGEGFGPWGISGNISTAVETSTTNGGTPGIDSAGVSFRILRTTSGFNQVTRSFTGALSGGQTFLASLDLALITGSAATGLYLTNASDGERWGLQYLGNRTTLDLKVNGVTFDSGIPVSDLTNGVSVAFTLAPDLSWSASLEKLGGGGTFSLESGSFSPLTEAPDGFRFFFANTTTGQRQYLNSMQIIPEPGAGLLACAGLAWLAGARRPRVRAGAR